MPNRGLLTQKPGRGPITAAELAARAGVTPTQPTQPTTATGTTPPTAVTTPANNTSPTAPVPVVPAATPTAPATTPATTSSLPPVVAPVTTPPVVPTAPPPTYQDDSVETALHGILTQGSPYLDAARTAGLQAANQRGLINSSIAAGESEKAAIAAAMPIASQDASQISARNLSRLQASQASGLSSQEYQQNFGLQALQNDSQERIAGMNIASNDREKAQAAADQAEATYAQLFASITNNENIPADARDKYLENISVLRDGYYSMIEQMYGLDLTWATPQQAAA